MTLLLPSEIPRLAPEALMLDSTSRVSFDEVVMDIDVRDCRAAVGDSCPSAVIDLVCRDLWCPSTLHRDRSLKAVSNRGIGDAGRGAI